ncbi:MAG TPA: pyridoxal phosphate-dependent aminotransferase [Candidatus Deferrimicrobiaceae bacterium]|jgi:aspartate aminotransferase
MPAAAEIREAILKGSWIRKMFEEGAQLKAAIGADKVYDFTLGNPYGNPPPRLAAEIARLADHPAADLHKYMSNAGFPEVRETIAGSLAKSTGVPFSGSMLVMTAGAAGALNIALHALLSPGDEVIVVAPYFVEYMFYIRNAGGVPVVAESDADFRLDPSAVAAALTARTKAIILNTPNNPTGTIYPESALRALDVHLAERERATGNPIYVISDEPYRKIVHPGNRFDPPAASLRNCLVAYSHSKDLNIPGERIGYLAVSPRAADADEVAEACVFCNRVLGFVNAPSLMQRAVASLQDEPADMSVYTANRDALLEVLGESGFRVLPPGGAFYLFVPTPGADEMEFVSAAHAENVLVVPGSGFGRPGHFRVAYCVSPGTVERSLPAWRRLGERFFGKRGGRS